MGIAGLPGLDLGPEPEARGVRLQGDISVCHKAVQNPREAFAPNGLHRTQLFGVQQTPCVQGMVGQNAFSRDGSDQFFSSPENGAPVVGVHIGIQIVV